MIKYKNLSGNSGVDQYDCGQDWILVQFLDGAIYRYTSTSASQYHITEMINLANRGWGLNSYIMKYVKTRYVR